MNRHSENIPDIDRLRFLADGYLDASLSDTENAELMDFVKSDLSASKEIPADLLLDLRMIASLNGGIDILPTAAVPDGLAQRLDNHISSLAKASRRKLIWRRIVASASAAAVLLFAVTFGVYRNHEPSSVADADTSLIPELNLAIPELNLSNPQPEQIAQSEPTPHVEAPTKSESHVTVHKPAPLKTQLSSAANVTAAVNTSAGVKSMAEVQESISEIMPTVSSAIVIPDKVTVHPLSVVSQAFDNIYHSIEIVSKAFSATNSDIDNSLNRIAQASDVTFHSI